MSRVTILVALGAAMLPLLTCGSDAPAPRPVDVFANLDGTWKGVYAGYDETGKELYRIRVEQRYHIVDDNTQKVTIRDTMSDGKVITGEGENLAIPRDDGSVELRCVVRKSNGETAEHNGRLVKGPDGDKQIIWYSKKPGKVEMFRETVRSEGGRTVYSINGTGRYGEMLILMNGRYYKE